MLAVSRGLDFLAVTDHNTVSHHRELGSRLGRLRGHAGARAGGDDLAGPRRGAGRHRVDRLQDLGRLVAGGGRARRRADVDQPPVRGGRQLAARDDSAGRRCSRSGTGPGSTRPGRRRCRGGRRGIRSAIPVGGSDWHRPGSDSPLGTPTTWVECDDDSGVAGVLEGLRAGRVAITRLARRAGTAAARRRIRWPIGADGLLLADPDGPVPADCRRRGLPSGLHPARPGRPWLPPLLTSVRRDRRADIDITSSMRRAQRSSGRGPNGPVASEHALRVR